MIIFIGTLIPLAILIVCCFCFFYYWIQGSKIERCDINKIYRKYRLVTDGNGYMVQRFRANIFGGYWTNNTQCKRPYFLHIGIKVCDEQRIYAEESLRRCIEWEISLVKKELQKHEWDEVEKDSEPLWFNRLLADKIDALKEMTT